MNIRIATVTATIALTLSVMTFADDDQREADLVRHAISLSGVTVGKALKMVEAQLAGIVYKYELEEADQGPVHEFDLVDLERERKIKAMVDIKSGQLLSTEEAYDFGWFVKEDEDVVAARELQASGFSLAEALGALAPQNDQVLLEAELEYKHGIRYFEFELMGPDGELEWLVDVNTQQLIPTLSRGAE